MSGRLIVRFLFLCAISPLLRSAPVAAQQPVILRGQVIDASTLAALGGVTVQLTPQLFTLTGPDGRFTLPGTPTGRYTLRVQGVGYVEEDIALILRSDTSIVITLTPAPFPLDPITARARTITVRGVVRDKASGLALIDVDVRAQGQRPLTDMVGRFKLNRIPAGVPVSIEVRELGYLPVLITLEAERDTTIEFLLEPDPVAARMILHAKRRLEERAGERRYNGLPVIDRPELVRNVNRSVDDVLKELLRTRTGRIRCVVLDEKLLPLGRIMLETMWPDRLEHVEVLEYDGGTGDLMIRLYTREFFGRFMARGEEIVPQQTLLAAARTGACR